MSCSIICEYHQRFEKSYERTPYFIGIIQTVNENTKKVISRKTSREKRISPRSALVDAKNLADAEKLRILRTYKGKVNVIY